MHRGALRRVAAHPALRQARSLYRGLLAGAAEAWYAVTLARLHRSKVPPGRLAVVAHVYYPDVWPTLRGYLKRLDGLPHDVVVTLPISQRGFRHMVRADFPAARVVAVPNRGRDVLPFLEVSRVLEEKGCPAVLKVHGKRSTSVDQESGTAWLETMLERLVPDDPGALQSIIDALAEPRTGVIGPAEVYFPLSVYFEWNKPLIMDTMRRVLGESVAEDVADHPAEYGFFAGSMFWTRLDALGPLLRLRSKDFDREKGRLDGTREHAVERVFTLAPSLRGRQNFEATAAGARPLTRRPSSVLPSWFPPPPE